MANGNATKSYLIPLSDLTLADRQEIRANVQAILQANAERLAIRDNLADLIIRDTLPFTDLGLAAQEDWLIAGAGILATELQYFSSLVAQDRVISFFGLGVESAAASISRVRLTLGAASTTVRGVFQLEALYSRLEPTGYFSSPIVYTRQETARPPARWSWCSTALTPISTAKTKCTRSTLSPSTSPSIPFK